MNDSFIGGSFRDPSGRVAFQNNCLIREIYQYYKENYNRLLDSGLYQELTSQGLLVGHEELPLNGRENSQIFKTIRPDYIPFITYPYEWSFSQLKDAALLTLDIQKCALKYGMSLKDASAYNIQFRGCTPVFIDTLSFESYQEGKPWVAYRQFCQHFLAPLILSSYCDIRLSQLLKVYIDGVPLDLASSLLPAKTRLNPGILMHIHMHAKYQYAYSEKGNLEYPEAQKQDIKRQALLGIIDSLETVIKKLTWKPVGTEWANYYQEGENNYTQEAFIDKKKIVEKYINQLRPVQVWDLGSNSGVFSRIASDQGIMTVSMDIDPGAVELNYQFGRENSDSNLMPLLMDICNPSPAIGWRLKERMSLLDRGPANFLMALALIHHLVIGNNIPLSSAAQFFAGICMNLVIEFVPREDSQVLRMLSSRADIFHDYHISGFRQAFAQYFEIIDERTIRGSARSLFLMKIRGQD